MSRLRFDYFCFVAAHCLLLSWFFFGTASWLILVGFVWAYLLVIVGQEAGAHRLFSHSSYEPKPWAEWFCAFTASVSTYGAVAEWCSSHALHHANADTKTDPTNPETQGLFGIYANLWKFRHPEATPASLRIAAKAMKRTPVQLMFKYYIPLNVIWVALITSFGYEALIWLWAMPILFVSYFMNTISIIGHSGAWDGKDKSTTHRFLDFMSPGTGNHKFHHRYPKQHRFAQTDLAAWVIERFLMVKR